MIFLILMAACYTGVYLLMVASTAWQDIVTGLALSIVLTWIFRSVLLPQPLPSSRRMLRAVLALPRFLRLVIRDVFVGTWTVTQCVVGLRPIEHPGIISIDIGDSTPLSVGIASLSITFSPGSFLIGVDWDERTMFVHVVDASDWEKVHDDMKEYLTVLDAALGTRSWTDHSPVPGAGGRG